jgi:CubicO group peptidase (beta-lactamase class C family)
MAARNAAGGFPLSFSPHAMRPFRSSRRLVWRVFQTFFWVDPENELVAVVMTQLYPWGDSTLWADFQRAVYADLERPAVRQPQPAR